MLGESRLEDLGLHTALSLAIVCEICIMYAKG